MKTKTIISLCIGSFLLVLIQSCCKNIACDVPPEPKIILIASLDSLGAGLTSEEFKSIYILKRTGISSQVKIDTLDKSYWYYSEYSDYLDYPGYDLGLGMMEGDQDYDYIIRNDFSLEIIIDNISLNFRISDSRCCSFRVLSLMSFDIKNKRSETSEYVYELIIEK